VVGIILNMGRVMKHRVLDCFAKTRPNISFPYLFRVDGLMPRKGKNNLPT